MRIAHIIDPLIGVIPDAYLTAVQDRQWHQDHLLAFENILASARGHGAEAVLITGRVFAEGFAADAAIADVLEIVRKQPCPVVWLPDRIGARYLRSNKNIPENLFLLSGRSNPEFVFGDARIFAWPEGHKPSGNCNILVLDETLTAENIMGTAMTLFPDLRYAVSGNTAYICRNGVFSSEKLAKMENTGFDDTKKSGYYMLKLENGKLSGRGKIETGVYGFRTLSIDVGPEDDLRSAVKKCEAAAAGLTRHDFVRVILNGYAGAEAFIDPERLCGIMKDNFFYLEIFGNCSLRPDENAYAGDISLKSEFTRRVLADDTLSETEKSRIIQCGWNALNGKDLSE